MCCLIFVSLKSEAETFKEYASRMSKLYRYKYIIYINIDILLEWTYFGSINARRRAQKVRGWMERREMREIYLQFESVIDTRSRGKR